MKPIATLTFTSRRGLDEVLIYLADMYKAPLVVQPGVKLEFFHNPVQPIETLYVTR
jgi:hypothetical protein